jgi:hypothetical protein
MSRKKYFLLSYIVLSMGSSLRAAIPQGFCVADHESKVYLAADFNKPYPRQVTFVCDYVCQGPREKKTIKGISKVSVTNLQDEMTSLLCQGVIVKKVSWGWDYDRTEMFYGFEARTSEVKSYAFKSLNRVPQEEAKRLLELHSNLLLVAKHFEATGHPDFIQASQFFSKINQELPQSEKELVNALTWMEKLDPTKDWPLWTRLVTQQLQVHAGWRIPPKR